MDDRQYLEQLVSASWATKVAAHELVFQSIAADALAQSAIAKSLAANTIAYDKIGAAIDIPAAASLVAIPPAMTMAADAVRDLRFTDTFATAANTEMKWLADMRAATAAASFSAADYMRETLSALNTADSAFSCLRAIAPAYAAADILKTAVVEQYKLPAIAEWDHLRTVYERVAGCSALSVFSMTVDDFQRTAMAIKTPWLDVAATDKSVLAMAELAAISRAVVADAPFSASVVAGLRQGLGDWRRAAAYPDSLMTDPMARRDYYAGLGFDATLTSLPLPAFEASLALGGPSRTHHRAASEDAPPAEGPAQNEAEVNLKAYGRLFALENRLRILVVRVLADIAGASWQMQRVHQEVVARWEERRHAHVKAGLQARELIYFADLGDLADIIMRNDNWSHGFGKVFGRKESVKESFFRLGPLRNCIAHSRPLMQDDLLLLFVETSRLMQAIQLAGM